MYADTDSAARLLEERHKFADAIPFLRSIAGAFPWNAAYKVRLASALLAVDQSSVEALGMLSAVAADPTAPYADRESAARSLKGHGAPASGSAELKLLAQSGCPLRDDADKPFFVYAREAAAACAPNAGVAEILLRKALATAPVDAQVRLQYIFAAFAAGRDVQALLAAQPLLQNDGGYGQNFEPSDAGAEPQSYPSPPQEMNASENPPQRTLSLASMKPADAAWFGAHAIRAAEAQRNLQQALNIAQSISAVLRDPSLRKPFDDERKRINAELQLEAENDARAPNVHAELAQDRIVRPGVWSQKPFEPLPAPAGEVQP
jgi:hypothetical protein